MGPSALLCIVVGVLERLGVRYFVTGSVATMAYSEARLTADVDVVAELGLEQVDAFCAAFPQDEYYVSVQAARQAVLQHSMFNVIHPDSGFKADIIIPPTDRFNAARFARARRLKAVADREIMFTSPEDAIIKKMEYYKEGESEKHLRDITGVMLVSGDHLDYAYIEQWAKELDVMEIWRRLQERVAQAKSRMPKPE